MMSSSSLARDQWPVPHSSSPAQADDDLAGELIQNSKSNVQHLAIPQQSSYRRPSLDSTYSDFSELSVHSGEFHRGRHPLLSTNSDHEQRRLPALSPGRTRCRGGIRGYADAFWLRNKGVLLVLLAMVFGSGMNVSARLMETDGSHGKAMHPFQILFARMSITVLLSLVYGFYTHIPNFPLGSKDVRFLLIIRGVGGFFGVFGLYWSLLYLPLAEATVLTFLAPILTCYACSFLIRGETFGRQQQIAGFLSLVGVVFIARPGGLFTSSSSSSNDRSGTVPSSMHSNTTSTVPVPSAATPTPLQQHQHLLAVLFAMIGVLGATTAMTTIRKIGTRAHPLISVNYFSSWCTIVSLVAVLAFPTVGFRLPGNVQEWGLLLLLGVFGFVMQFLLTAGLAYGGPASSSGPGTNVDLDTEFVESRPNRERVVGDLVAGEDEEDAGVNNATIRTSTKASTSAAATAAATKGSGTRATSMLYTQMLFALAFDKWIWGLSPGWSSWVGSVIILACAVWVAAARDLQQKKETGKEGVAGSGSMSLAKVRNRSGIGQEEDEAQGLLRSLPPMLTREEDDEGGEDAEVAGSSQPSSNTSSLPPISSAGIELKTLG